MANDFSGTAVIDRPPEEVFDFLADGANDRKFSPRVLEIEKATDGPVGVGTIYKSTVKDAGMKTTREFEITEFERPSRIRWAERSKNLVTASAGGYDLTPADGGTRLKVFNELEGHGFGKLILPLALRSGPQGRGRIRGPDQAGRRIQLNTPPVLMGVVNVTPDSFSDGGEFLDPDAAVAHGTELAAAGAAILDIGGESTRPGADPVSEEEELRRTIPVVKGLATVDCEISIDTTKAAVAEAALEAGASIVNDVSALRFDPLLAGLVADRSATCCLMHMLGEPRTMQSDPRYEDVVSEVRDFLEERLAFAIGEGVAEERVWLDPGIGFGKTVAHNLELLRRLDEIVAIGRPVVVGTSRKSFLGKLTGGRGESERLPGTIATNVIALERGATIFRVHDVAQNMDALTVAAATFGPPEEEG